MKIGKKVVNNFGLPPIIAEIGSNHNGSIDLALETIDVAVDAGVDGVKFQHFDLSLFADCCYEDDARRVVLMEKNSVLEQKVVPRALQELF